VAMRLNPLFEIEGGEHGGGHCRMKTMYRNCIRRPAVIPMAMVVVVLLLAGCSTLHSHWPFAHRAAAAPAAVAELQVQWPDRASPPVVLQYWERNTLVVDLTSVASQGQITLRPAAGHSWPARIAMRMPPRRFGELEVRGAERIVLPLAAGGDLPVTAELPAGMYAAQTAQLIVSWGATGSF